MSSTSGRTLLIIMILLSAVLLALGNVLCHALVVQELTGTAPPDRARRHAERSSTPSRRRSRSGRSSSGSSPARRCWSASSSPCWSAFDARRRRAAGGGDRGGRCLATDGALRLLGLLQQEGRLIDFLEEDIAPYSDAQVGAAVRAIHAGCRTALHQRMQIERIYRRGGWRLGRGRSRIRRGARCASPATCTASRPSAASCSTAAGARPTWRCRRAPASTRRSSRRPRWRSREREPTSDRDAPRARQGAPLRRRRGRPWAARAESDFGVTFVVGIDLGTTNSVVAYVPLAEEAAPIAVLPIPQLTAPGTVEARPLLPSFLYLPAGGELPEQALRLPWGASADAVVGAFAQKRGGEVPGPGRRARRSRGCRTPASIAPRRSCRGAAPTTCAKLSPVDGVGALPRAPARGLGRAVLPTRRSPSRTSCSPCRRRSTPARASSPCAPPPTAGLPQVTRARGAAGGALRLDRRQRRGAGARRCAVGDVILVCDVGGGTTDFSLDRRARGGRRARARARRGRRSHPARRRQHGPRARLPPARAPGAAGHARSTPGSSAAWCTSCRDAKERLLGDGGDADAAGRHPRPRLARWSAARCAPSSRAPTSKRRWSTASSRAARSSDRPQRPRRTGLQELGLPYAADPAVTRHLAPSSPPGRRRRRRAADGGAVQRRRHARRRRCARAWSSVLDGWFADGGSGVRVLGGADPDLAVARGAAYYGLARRGRGVRIRGGTARAYYVGIESAMPAVPGMRPPLKALCVAPLGLEEGSEVELPAHEFGLVVGEPAEFRFFSSSTPPRRSRRHARSTTGTTTSSRSCRRSPPRSSGTATTARRSRCTCRRASPRSACSSCGASAATSASAGSSSSTSRNR